MKVFRATDMKKTTIRNKAYFLQNNLKYKM